MFLIALTFACPSAGKLRRTRTRYCSGKVEITRLRESTASLTRMLVTQLSGHHNFLDTGTHFYSGALRA
jgi:hypothetical protein